MARTTPVTVTDILTAEQFAEQRKDQAFPTRRNVALNKGGSVDLYTSAEGKVLAVLRHATLTAEVKAEVEPLLAAARTKAKAEPAEKSAEPAPTTEPESHAPPTDQPTTPAPTA